MMDSDKFFIISNLWIVASILSDDFIKSIFLLIGGIFHGLISMIFLMRRVSGVRR